MKMKKTVIILSILASLLVLAVTVHVVDQRSHETDAPAIPFEAEHLVATVFDDEGNFHIVFTTPEPNATTWYSQALREPDGSFTWLAAEQIHFNENQGSTTDWSDEA